MTGGQLVMPSFLDGAYWVTVWSHGIIKDGTRFLIVDERPDGWLIGWRDGLKPRNIGALLSREKIRREDGQGPTSTS